MTGEPNTLTDAERAAGWRLLFDGQTLNGWKPYRKVGLPTGWEAVSGELRLTLPDNPHLVTTEQFTRFDLRFDFRVDEGADGGVLYHVDETQKDPWQGAPEFQVADDARAKSWRSGAMVHVEGPAAPSRAARKPGEWNHARILAEPGKVTHFLYGDDGKAMLVKYFDRTLPDFQKNVTAGALAQADKFWNTDHGRIGLLAATGVAYRNIKIRAFQADGKPIVPSESGEFTAVVYLDDLLEDDVKCYDKDRAGKHGLDFKDQPFSWRGKPVSQSLYTHPTQKGKKAHITYSLSGRYAEFRATVGLVRRPSSPQVFRVFNKDLLMWESEQCRDPSVSHDVQLNVTGVNLLRLEVESFGDMTGAHAVWIEPRLYGAVAVKSATEAPPSTADILTSSDWEWTPPENLGPAINSPNREFCPALSGDGLTLIFSSDREQRGRFELWECRRKSVAEPFGECAKLPAPVNTSSTESDPCLSWDGVTLIYATSDQSGGSQGGFDLRMTTRKNVNSPWGKVQSLGTAVNTPADEHAPMLSRDGLTLAFQSNREDSAGSHDLWIARRKSVDDPFEIPSHVGKKVNTKAREESPRLLLDGKFLLYTREISGKYSQIQLADVTNPTKIFVRSLVLPGDDAVEVSDRFPLLWSDERTLYYSSNRPGGQGDFDLWMTRRVPIKSPPLVADAATTTESPKKKKSKTATPSPAPTSATTSVGPTPLEILTSPDWEWSAPENLGPQVNSSVAEESPTVSADGLTLIFQSPRPGGKGGKDLWQSRRANVDQPFGAPMNLDAAINSRVLDDDPHLTFDGRRLLFSSPRSDQGLGGSDIWMSERSDVNAPWGPAVNLGAPVNSSAPEFGPCLSPDELTLVFHSSRPGGRGGDDLWISRRPSRIAPFSEPVNLGPEINTADREGGASLSSDGLVLIFHRRSDEELGDLWMSHRDKTEAPFGLPVRLPEIINHPKNGDMNPELSADGRTLYFNSTRFGGQGTHDLWLTRRVKKTK